MKEEPGLSWIIGDVGEGGGEWDVGEDEGGVYEEYVDFEGSLLDDFPESP